MLPPSDPDAPVRATDTDAALARLSAVRKRYLDDPYIAPLVPRPHLQPPRPPLINVGTYLRARAIDALVDRWIRAAPAHSAVQIVSLGAGSDTRFWRLQTGPHAHRVARYLELDFPEVTSKKAMAIRKSPLLSAPLGSPESVSLAAGGTALRSDVYNLLPVDLRLPPETSLASVLTTASPTSPPLLSPHLPTLLLFECVLVYMHPSASDALIRWFADYCTGPNPSPSPSTGSNSNTGALGCIVYEMFGLTDAFGRVMLNNLRSRGVALPGADPYPTRASLPQRFLRLGFSAAHALTLREIRADYTPRPELERLSTLELLDEIEELDLVLAHYAITWGIKLPGAGPDPGTDSIADSNAEAADAARPQPAAWLAWGLDAHPARPAGAEDE
ncbi:hypothetical protein HETIRDRAFT_332300 [Heterobasidion irregulare TC 32-1]|uniref:Leucine carboxyl methyltransferase 1 n=1 Tax=Heterobasidion irregulare (strain TC 32-1) TaxID=747525 RepID=W4JMT4_HETIT|nr:uncharacterized protein HETIRDRAFT_332300 [Heterobasidion irregulare TC 32-1]ETW74838.1 hypothetical protein HETIRDRAFT_332300 [Heterobasidion irregulare TC 32-1]